MAGGLSYILKSMTVYFQTLFQNKVPEFFLRNFFFFFFHQKSTILLFFKNCVRLSCLSENVRQPQANFFYLGEISTGV